MQTELEAKFLAVDHEALRHKLKALGAVCKYPMRLMKRYNFDFPDRRLEHELRGWVRVRDEGDKVTISYKQLNDRSLHGTKEICVKVSSFEDAKAFLEAIGLKANAYQETKRESWQLGDVEIELDQWPWTRPYIEMEAASEEALRQAAKRLELNWAEVLHGSVEVVYQAEYNVTDAQIYGIEAFTFELPVPEVLMTNRRAA